ncbi:hypothetical protein CXB51_016478 [Gossypium anomalum]|uniref:Uncharacterized protein n=1 Tax=Gossypium anomalum TaxID=47600 RepID=A0A8J6CUZ8_9ROSI|nr:hypothetical protein CXB51_016478 [Gossypium anomalum]
MTTLRPLVLHAPTRRRIQRFRRLKTFAFLGKSQVIKRRNLWPLINAPITDPGITALMELLERRASKGPRRLGWLEASRTPLRR